MKFAFAFLLASTSLQSFAEESFARKWVCAVYPVGRGGTVYGHGATEAEARESALSRCFPNSYCAAHMHCAESK